MGAGTGNRDLAKHCSCLKGDCRLVKEMKWMVMVQYDHSTGSGVYRRLEHIEGVPVPVLDKTMLRGE